MSKKEAYVSPGSPSVESERSEKISFNEDDDCGLLSSYEEEAPVNARVTRSSAEGKDKATFAGNVASIPLDGVSFHSEEGASLRKYVVKQKIVDEKELSPSIQECLDLMDLLLEAELDKTVLCLGLFYPQLAREFIVNLSADFDNPSSLSFQKVNIWGHQFEFSTAIINKFLLRNVPNNVTEQHLPMKKLVFELTSGARTS